MLLSQENTASPCEAGKETGVVLDESKLRHSLPSSVSSCHFSAALFDGGGKESSSPLFLYLPKPRVAWFLRRSTALERQFSPGVLHLTKAPGKHHESDFHQGKGGVGRSLWQSKEGFGGWFVCLCQHEPFLPFCSCLLGTSKVPAGHPESV